MSGILGFVGNTPQRLDPGKVRRALALLERRGLDDKAIFLFDASGHFQAFLEPTLDHLHCSNATGLRSGLPTTMLACCRLQVEDPRSRGSSSIGSADGQIFLAFDGVIDNGQELSLELQKLGQDVRSGCSFHTVLLAALEEWGPDCLSRLKGSFALAAIDFHSRNLILARDAFGTRPLYYSSQSGKPFFFASQIDALLEVSCAARRVNRGSLYRYLVYNTMDHGSQTFFEAINQVPSGSYLEVALDQPTRTSLTRYRRVVAARTKLTFEQASKHLRELIVRSVASQLGTHDALGAALSGGFDSCFVAAAFKGARPDAVLNLYTCVPVVKDGAFAQSEEVWAEMAAAGLNAPLKKVRVSSGNLPRSFASLVCLHEEPFSSPVVYAHLAVFRAAQIDGVKLMLSGQGGDTMFATSTKQLLRAVLAQVSRGRWGNAAAILRASGQLPNRITRRLAAAAARTVMPKGLQAFVKQPSEWPGLEWLKREWFEIEVVGPADGLGLPMLRFEDRNAMACSILNRMPLLTTEVQDFVGSLPPEYLVTADQPMKSIESAAMRGIVPNAILARRERSGFPVPVREWLIEQTPWVEKNIAALESFPFLRPHGVRRVWEYVRSKNQSVSAAFMVWRWVFLAGWMRFFSVTLD